MLCEISQNSHETSGNIFFDKTKLCRSPIFLKRRLFLRYFLKNFAKFVRAPSLQNTTGCICIEAVPIVVKGELVNKTVNYDAKTKV